MTATPKPDRVCPECKNCNGSGYVRTVYTRGDCKICHGTGESPSIEAKPPLASVDATLDVDKATQAATIAVNFLLSANDVKRDGKDAIEMLAEKLEPVFASLPAAPDAVSVTHTNQDGEIQENKHGKLPSIEAKPPLASVDAAPTDAMPRTEFKGEIKEILKAIAPDAGPTKPNDPTNHRAWVVYYGLMVDVLRTELAAARAELASESRWAKHYLDRAEAAEQEAERLRGELATAKDDLIMASTTSYNLHSYINELRAARDATIAGLRAALVGIKEGWLCPGAVQNFIDAALAASAERKEET